MAGKQIKEYSATLTPSRDDLLLKQPAAGGVYETITPADIVGLLEAGDIPSHAASHGDGGSDEVLLDASQVATGALALARGGTGVDLSATGAATHVLAQDASHVISARALVAADLPTVPVSKGGTNVTSLTGSRVLKSASDGLSVEALTGTGFLKLTSDVPSVAALVRADMPTGGLFTDAAISSTLQAIEDKDGNTSSLKIGTGDIEVNSLTVGRGSGGIDTNSAFGYTALNANTTGSYNSAFGNVALYANTTGYRNSAFGYAALYANTTGSYNNAFGNAALYANTTGYRNNAFGNAALNANTTGNYNSAFGYTALNANTTGSYNSAFGNAALYANTTGYQNSAFGYTALYANTTGYTNSAFGRNAGRYAGTGATPNETSTESIYIGYQVRSGADGRNRENVIGYDITGNGDNTTTIGEKPVFPDMPTSSAGLPSGALWCDTSDSNRIKMV